MIEWLTSFFGVYSPPTYQLWDETAQMMQEYIPAGAAGVDWPYIGRVLVFCIVLYCFFRTLGGLVCRS